MLGLYIHFPFCKRKCDYCAFYSLPMVEKKHAYVEALMRNICVCSNLNQRADTVYFGGGTPSLLSPDEVGGIMSNIRPAFEIPENAEITLEANPSSVSLESLKAYREVGVNRLSLGVQSLDDRELLALGRLHSSYEALKAVDDAQEAGFDNISCDLMIGIPYQTEKSLERSCDGLIKTGISHISSYMLKIEENSPFDCDRVRNLAADDDTVSDMYLMLCERLRQRDFERYEISNFAKNGLRSRHNMKYWTGEDYLGFGPSAHSFYNGKRFYVPDDLDGFISSDTQKTLTEDDCPDILEEYVMLSLRLSDGMSLSKLASLGGNAEAVKPSAKRLEEAGLLKSDGERIILSDKGCLVSNGVIFEIYDAAVSPKK